MAWKEQLVLVFLTWILEGTKGQDAQVTCVFSGRCILPCQMKPHVGEEVVHWYHTKNLDNPVHSYYLGEEQLAHQDPKYAGRTSLFLDQIPLGNESLLLADVKIQDEGRYKCYTSTKKENDETTFVNLKVEAPVQSVNITVAADKLTCSSEGIYPAPVLVWSTVPLSDLQQENETEKQTNAQGLFSITSTVHMSPNNTFMCSVTAGDSTMKAFLRQQSLRAKEGENLVLPCDVPVTNLKDFTLIWLFNESSTVLTFDSSTSDPKVDKQWKDHVKYKTYQTAIELYNLNADTFNGQYSCEVFTTELRHLEQTSVSGIANSTAALRQEVSVTAVIGVTLFILIISFVIAFCIWKRNRSEQTGEPDGLNLAVKAETSDLPNEETRDLPENGGKHDLAVKEETSDLANEETRDLPENGGKHDLAVKEETSDLANEETRDLLENGGTHDLAVKEETSDLANEETRDLPENGQHCYIL